MSCRLWGGGFAYDASPKMEALLLWYWYASSYKVSIGLDDRLDS